MIERPQWYRPSAAARAGFALLSALKRCLGSRTREAGGRARPTHLAGSDCLLCLMHESNFEMLVCLVYASCSATPRVVRPLGSWYARWQLLDGQSSWKRHLFAAVSFYAAAELLEAETACHPVERPHRCTVLLTSRPPHAAAQHICGRKPALHNI